VKSYKKKAKELFLLGFDYFVISPSDKFSFITEMIDDNLQITDPTHQSSLFLDCLLENFSDAKLWCFLISENNDPKKLDKFLGMAKKGMVLLLKRVGPHLVHYLSGNGRQQDKAARFLEQIIDFIFLSKLNNEKYLSGLEIDKIADQFLDFFLKFANRFQKATSEWVSSKNPKKSSLRESEAFYSELSSSSPQLDSDFLSSFDSSNAKDEFLNYMTEQTIFSALPNMLSYLAALEPHNSVSEGLKARIFELAVSMRNLQLSIDYSGSFMRVQGIKERMTVVETLHPYQDNMCTYAMVHHRGAKELKITFDNHTASESNYDKLRIYLLPGEEKEVGEYSGNRSCYPTNPILIPSDFVFFAFTSDGSNTDWGVRAYVSSQNKAKSWILEVEELLTKIYIQMQRETGKENMEKKLQQIRTSVKELPPNLLSSYLLIKSIHSVLGKESISSKTQGRFLEVIQYIIHKARKGNQRMEIKEEKEQEEDTKPKQDPNQHNTYAAFHTLASLFPFFGQNSDSISFFASLFDWIASVLFPSLDYPLPSSSTSSGKGKEKADEGIAGEGKEKLKGKLKQTKLKIKNKIQSPLVTDAKPKKPATRKLLVMNDHRADMQETDLWKGDDKWELVNKEDLEEALKKQQFERTQYSLRKDIFVLGWHLYQELILLCLASKSLNEQQKESVTHGIEILMNFAEKPSLCSKDKEEKKALKSEVLKFLTEISVLAQFNSIISTKKWAPFAKQFQITQSTSTKAHKLTTKNNRIPNYPKH